MNKSADLFFEEGCGRCELGGTPDCKVHSWTSELAMIREILLETGLVEECKWGVPCYTYDRKNVVLLYAFKQHCAISFLKGVILADPEGLLEKPGENSQSGRFMKFTSVDEVQKAAPHIRSYCYEAIEVEKAGLKVGFKKRPEPIPVELQEKLDEDPIFREAFEGLTPGRQRGYILHFSAPKQAKTRYARIEKHTPQILNGEGMHDNYKKKK